MDYQTKFSILSQDLVRRLLNTKDTIPQSKRNQIIDKYTDKLFNSGYNTAQVRQIVIAGIRGYTRKVNIALQAGTDLHRSAASSLDSRIRKKIFEKTSWFKGNNKKKESITQKSDKKRSNQQKQKAMDIKSVLFVPRTDGGELLKRLRKKEADIAEITGYRVGCPFIPTDCRPPSGYPP